MEFTYPLERSRGYPDRGKLWCGGRFTVELKPGGKATLLASAEEWDALGGLRPGEAFEAERKRRERALAASPAGGQADPAAVAGQRTGAGAARAALARHQARIIKGLMVNDAPDSMYWYYLLRDGQGWAVEPDWDSLPCL